MTDIVGIKAEESELVQIISRLPEFAWLKSAPLSRIREEIEQGVIATLREYFKENTQGTRPNWTLRFERAGITEDDGKTAISCVRRLGIEI